MTQETETLQIQVEGSGNNYTMRLGNYTGTGPTREAAFTALAQRIEGLPQSQRATLWGIGQQGAGGASRG